MLVEEIGADGYTDSTAHWAGLSYGTHSDGTVLLGDHEVDGHDEVLMLRSKLKPMIIWYHTIIITNAQKEKTS